MVARCAKSEHLTTPRTQRLPKTPGNQSIVTGVFVAVEVFRSDTVAAEALDAGRSDGKRFHAEDCNKDRDR
jgi:hypothetical protein